MRSRRMIRLDAFRARLIKGVVSMPSRLPSGGRSLYFRYPAVTSGFRAADFVALEKRVDQSLNWVTTSVALWPPKPKELFTATRTLFSRATFGV